jgi:N-glycosylase/DNA lyase
MKVTIDAKRAGRLGTTLALLTEDTYRAIDRQEPEYAAFARMAKPYAAAAPHRYDESLAVLAIGTALIDYQQRNGAQTIWGPLERHAQDAGHPDSPDGLQDILLRLAGQSRFPRAKHDRIKRFFHSSFPAYLRDYLADARADPEETWQRLAYAMDAPPEMKTIVFGMKAFEMETLAVTGRYLALNPSMPIIADSRVAKLALTSGIIAGKGIAEPGDVSRSHRETLIEAWGQVARSARDAGADFLSPYRLDSMAWQAAEYDSPDDALRYFTRLGVPRPVASSVAADLFQRVPAYTR